MGRPTLAQPLGEEAKKPTLTGNLPRTLEEGIINHMILRRNLGPISSPGHKVSVLVLFIVPTGTMASPLHLLILPT